MTEPLRKYRSSDVPEFSSYPAEPEVVTINEFMAISEFDALPESQPNAYEEQARKIGTALGRLVNRINEITESSRSQIREHMSRVEDEVGLATDAASSTFEDATRKVRDMTKQSIYQARARASQLQRRAADTVEEYPVHTLAAVGVAGIIAGVGLRLWRENRG